MNTPINGLLIQQRRIALALPLRAISDHSDASQSVLTDIEQNQPTNITVAQLTRIAEYLGLPLEQLLTAPADDDPTPSEDTDISALTAVLLRAEHTGQQAQTAHVAHALGWTLERVHTVIQQANPRLRPAGLRIRSTAGRVHLATYSDHSDVQARYMTTRTADTGGRITDHRLFLKIAAGPVPLKRIHQGTRRALQRLIEQRLVATDGTTAHLTEPVLNALDPQRIRPEA